MRSLLRLIFAKPAVLFSSVAVAVVVAAVVAWIWSERRARALAQLSDDPDLASGQVRRLLIVATVTLSTLGLAGWWTLVRTHTEVERVLVAIAVETPDGSSQLWDKDRGASALAERLDAELDEVGLETVWLDADARERLREHDDPEAVLAAARGLEARWLIRGQVRSEKVIPLALAEFSDYIMSVELELVDTESGELFELPGMPTRVFLWGTSPSAAIDLNADYVAERVTMPLIATLAARPALREYAGDRTAMTTKEAVLATALERLFARADRLAAGRAQRVNDEAKALERESTNHAAIPQVRISDILAEEYWIGTASDGRVLLLSEPKFITVVPDKLGYEISSEGETLSLASADGHARSLLFEHYNFYSDPEISADGEVVWTTVANHGASKTLATVDVATGVFEPVLSHESAYYTSPVPTPDGSRALFYSRAGRYAETAIELVDRDGSHRKTIVDAGEQAGEPVWAHDGRTLYIPLGGWERIVAIDVDSGALRHVLGHDPSADLEPDPDLDPNADLDPASNSRFSQLTLGHAGRYLYVVEQSVDGREWLGRFDLEAPFVEPDSEPAPDPQPDSQPDPERDPPPPSPYIRLAEVGVGRLLASPVADVVVFEAPAFTAKGDPDSRDQEILVWGPDPGQLRAVTLDEVDNELAGWSRDGRSVFTIQRHRDPGSERRPVVRVYRHDLP